jgi:prepilin-type N-terminal cleavage/methylation domain-containing protein
MHAKWGRKPASGFSLVELLVVIAIISIMTAILLPVIASMRKQAKSVVCINNLHTLGLGIQGYATDYGGKVPYMHQNYFGEQAIIYKWKIWGLGLMYPNFIEDLRAYKAPSGEPSSMVIDDYGKKSFVVCDYNYWQVRNPFCFKQDQWVNNYWELSQRLLVTDEMMRLDWQGFKIMANHTDGLHFLAGSLYVDFLNRQLGSGIKMGYTAPPELPPLITEIENMCENN